jgi:Uncharacterized protein conserved in bacteria (DUF2325)
MNIATGMALDPHLVLSATLPRPAPIAARRGPVRLVARNQDGALELEPDESQSHGSRRTRIWEFDASLHCSIVGTCLTTAELRHVLDKLKIGATASDHELHALGVSLAGRREAGAKFLQKALDRRHRVAVTRYSKAKNLVALAALWAESLKQGDIPGSYWAVLTHPLATEELAKQAFGDVHMLSHLVGAANRADIRRLRELEQQNAVLADKIERQQRRLQEGFVARDRTIQRLNEMLAASDRAESPPAPAPNAEEAADGALRDLNRRFARETARRERSEARASQLAAALQKSDDALQRSERRSETVERELESIEAHLAALAEPSTAGSTDALDVSGITVLYVGGRAHQTPQIKGLIEGAGGRFLHHDGGLEQSSGLLPGLIGRADRVLFPIDCISHDAVATIKRVCRALGRSYEPLRTASLACVLAALLRMRGSREQAEAQ